MAKKPRPGKDFELLVSRLEEVLSPVNAVVKSPDYITDLITAQRREVDASIRVGSGDTVRLITVECRDHKRGRQDDRWIEQLITKREKIGAFKTIAVSSSGFSDSAVKTAAHYNVLLRQMSHITDAELMQECIGGLRISIISHEASVANVRVLDNNGGEVLLEDLLPLTNETDVTRMGLIGVGAKLLSLDDLFKAQTIYPTHGEEFPLTVTLGSSVGTLWIKTNEGKHIVSRVEVHYEVFRKEVPTTLESVGQYASRGKTLLDVVNTTAEIGDVEIRMEFIGHIGRRAPVRESE